MRCEPSQIHKGSSNLPLTTAKFLAACLSALLSSCRSSFFSFQSAPEKSLRNRCCGLFFEITTILPPEWVRCIFLAARCCRHLHACRDEPQPSVKNCLTLTCGPPILILFESVSHSKGGRRVPLQPRLLALDFFSLALASDEHSCGLVWVVAERRGVDERAHHVVVAAQVPRFILSQLRELHRANVRGKPAVCSTPVSNSETRLFQRLCRNCEVQPGCLILCYSSGPLKLNKRNVAQNAGVYGLDFLEMVQQLTICSFSQK